MLRWPAHLSRLWLWRRVLTLAITPFHSDLTG
jgi:hypothetical protein